MLYSICHSYYEAAEIPLGCSEGYKMTVESTHLEVHVELATRCLGNITDVHNKSQRAFTIIFGNATVL